MTLDVSDDIPIGREAFRRLGEKEDGAGEVEVTHVVEVFHNNSTSVGLPDQAKHFGMAFLAKDNHLSVLRLLPLTLHPALQGQHHRTRRVNDCDVIALGRFVGRWWFAMGSEQHRCIVKLLKLFMIDGDQSLVSKTLHLDTVVYDVAKAVEGLACLEFFLRFVDGSGHTEAKATA